MDTPLEKPAQLEERSSEPTAYDNTKYSHIVDWTHTSVLLHGRPITIISAEFQYFRVPDRERWLPLLSDIKSMGFNTVRLYIHWGYHNPSEGVYNFRGNRDIDYLLSICVQLELYVIVAPGPYICAEVQAGGYPIWLIAKRDLRIRHLTSPPLGMFKKWDQRWHDYCADYMRLIVSMLIKWELTTNPKGCIIAMQVENELREKPTIGFGGIDDEIRLLCEISREVGSTVPFFHNDDSPIGSWSSGSDYRSAAKGGVKTGKKAYRTDFYGFDLYFTFPPGDRSGDLSSMQVGMLEACGISACLNCCGIGGTGIGGSDTPCLSCLYDTGTKHAPPPALGWSTANQMESAVDVLEKTLYKFNGSARHAPTIVAETQVGWINQWGRMRTYDDTYNFFGDDFSCALQNSLLAQGVTVINHYIAYGGTNHGTVGDTEVYSSYDYSAFIREFGLLSRRGRVLRLSNLFARSFSDIGFSNSTISEKCNPKLSKSLVAVKSTIPSALINVRDAVLLNSSSSDSLKPSTTKRTSYAFLRNLKEDHLRFSLVVDNLVLPCKLTKCESHVVPLYHNLRNSDLSIFACTVPVICRTDYDNSEMWICRVRKEEVGRLILKREEHESNDNDPSKLKILWSKINDESPHSSSTGEIFVSHTDEGAATSLFSAPLEELPLANHGSLATENDVPIGVKASTEEIGRCFSFSFSANDAFGVAIYETKNDGSEQIIFRILCITDDDADTFSANLLGNDRFPGNRSKHFSAAWGVSNLTFLPDDKLDVGMAPQDDDKHIFLIQGGSGENGIAPEQFQCGSKSIISVIPGLWKYKVDRGSIHTLMNQGSDSGNVLSNDFQVPIENWTKRQVDWNDNVSWKEITYSERDPLDHLMTSGHVTYRISFKCSKKRGSIITNIRHSAVIWCNGKAVGSQICFSHNVMSAGAMHGIDLEKSGKRRHDISAGLEHGPNEDGYHEIIIVVLSMGQSRSPFLLNDVRNKRGLLSGRLSRTMGATDIKFEIAGIDVTRTDDAYGWSGLHLEEEAQTNFENGFHPATEVSTVVADEGIVFYRGSFKVPPNSIVDGNVRYPLRLKVKSGAGVRAFIWVNGLLMGRYVEPLGPQTEFYVPEGLIKDCKGNSIVFAVYGSVDSEVSFRLLPWVVDPLSGNCDESSGSVFALRKATFDLGTNLTK